MPRRVRKVESPECKVKSPESGRQNAGCTPKTPCRKRGRLKSPKNRSNRQADTLARKVRTAERKPPSAACKHQNLERKVKTAAV